MNLIHDLDFLHYVADMEIKEVFAYMDTLFHPIDVEDSLGAVIKAKNDAIGTISASTTVRGHGNSGLRIWGAIGQLLIEGNQVKFYSHKRLGSYEPGKWYTKVFEEQVESRTLFFREFRRQLQRSEKSSMNDSGFRTLAIISAMYESADKGDKVEVKYS